MTICSFDTPIFDTKHSIYVIKRCNQWQSLISQIFTQEKLQQETRSFIICTCQNMYNEKKNMSYSSVRLLAEHTQPQQLILQRCLVIFLKQLFFRAPLDGSLFFINKLMVQLTTHYFSLRLIFFKYLLWHNWK